MKNPFQNESFSRLALLALFHALFMILSPVFIIPALMIGLISESDALFQLCQVILLAALPFLIGYILAKKGKWWWLIAIPVQLLFYLDVLYVYEYIIMEHESFQLLSSVTLPYIPVPLIGQAAGITARLLHRKRE